MPEEPRRARAKKDAEAMIARELKERAAIALDETDFEQLLNLPGMSEQENGATDVALKHLLAEKAAEYIIGAAEITNKKKMKRLGPAALFMAAEQERW